MKRFFWPVVFALATQGLPAQASLVREVGLDNACDGNTDIVVYEGMGAVLDFTQTNYVVQRAWLGDPSKLTLDTDGPMEQGATKVIYLRAINELSFAGLPSTATTVLTAGLRGPEGSMLCQFPISYGSGNPTYTSTRMMDGSLPSTDSRTQTSTVQVNIDDVEAGINLNAATIGEDSPVVQRINSFITRVRSGQPQQSTAQELGIEWPLIIELERQGAASNRYDTVST